MEESSHIQKLQTGANKEGEEEEPNIFIAEGDVPAVDLKQVQVQQQNRGPNNNHTATINCRPEVVVMNADNSGRNENIDPPLNNNTNNHNNNGVLNKDHNLNNGTEDGKYTKFSEASNNPTQVVEKSTAASTSAAVTHSSVAQQNEKARGFKREQQTAVEDTNTSPKKKKRRNGGKKFCCFKGCSFVGKTGFHRIPPIVKGKYEDIISYGQRKTFMKKKFYREECLRRVGLSTDDTRSDLRYCSKHPIVPKYKIVAIPMVGLKTDHSLTKQDSDMLQRDPQQQNIKYEEFRFNLPLGVSNENKSYFQLTSENLVARYNGPDLATMNECQRKIRSEILETRPNTGLAGPFGPWLAKPEIAAPAQQLGKSVRYGLTLSRPQSELIILLTAAKHNCVTEFDLHHGEAIRAGVFHELIDRIPVGVHFSTEKVVEELIPLLSDENDKQVTELAAELLHSSTVSDTTYEKCKRALGKDGDEKIVEITSLVGYYTLVAYTLNVFNIPSRPPEPPNEKVKTSMPVIEPDVNMGSQISNAIMEL